MDLAPCLSLTFQALDKQIPITHSGLVFQHRLHTSSLRFRVVSRLFPRNPPSSFFINHTPITIQHGRRYTDQEIDVYHIAAER
jgi:hypothetical protein